MSKRSELEDELQRLQSLYRTFNSSIVRLKVFEKAGQLTADQKERLKENTNKRKEIIKDLKEVRRQLRLETAPEPELMKIRYYGVVHHNGKVYTTAPAMSYNYANTLRKEMISHLNSKNELVE